MIRFEKKGNVVATILLATLVIVATIVLTYQISDIKIKKDPHKVVSESDITMRMNILQGLDLFVKNSFANTSSACWYCNRPFMPEISEASQAFSYYVNQEIKNSMNELRNELEGYNYTINKNYIVDTGSIDPVKDANKVRIKVKNLTVTLYHNNVKQKKNLSDEYFFNYRAWFIYNTVYNWMKNNDSSIPSAFYSHLFDIEDHPCQAMTCSCYERDDQLITNSDLNKMRVTQDDILRALNDITHELNQEFSGSEIVCEFYMNSSGLTIQNNVEIEQRDVEACDKVMETHFYKTWTSINPEPEFTEWSAHQLSDCGTQRIVPNKSITLERSDNKIINYHYNKTTALPPPVDDRVSTSKAEFVGVSRAAHGDFAILCKDMRSNIETETGFEPFTARFDFEFSMIRNCNPPPYNPDNFTKISCADYRCYDHNYTACYDNDIYWFDSCGVPEERSVDCGETFCGLFSSWQCISSRTREREQDCTSGCEAGSCVGTFVQKENETCNIGDECIGGVCVPCTISCATEGYACGTWDICGLDTKCGACIGGTMCNVTGGCECVDNNYTGCYMNDSYIFDSCDNPTSLVQDCGSTACGTFGSWTCFNSTTKIQNRTCTNGCNLGTCEASYFDYNYSTCNLGMACESGTCVPCPQNCVTEGYTCGWWDFCGLSNYCGSCTGGRVCSSTGTCTCLTHNYTACYDHDVYWFDSCGQVELDREQDCLDPVCTDITPWYCEDSDTRAVNQTCNGGGCAAGACTSSPYVYKNLVDCNAGETCVLGQCVTQVSITGCEELQMIGYHPDFDLDLEYLLSSDISCSATDPSNGGHSSSLWGLGYSARYPDGLDGVPGTGDENIPELSLAMLGNDGFRPIGYDFANYFSGIFQGQTNTISDIYIDRDNSYVGLFGIADSAIITNFYLEDPEIIGMSNVGGIAGYVEETQLSNLFVNGGSVSGDYSGADLSIGGLVGETYNSTIVDCGSTADVDGDYQDDAVGGLVGNAQSSFLQQTYSIGDIYGNDHVGGLIGYDDDSNIDRSFSQGDVNALALSGYGSYAGGFVGGMIEGTINDSFSTSSVKGSDQIGGFVGYTYQSNIIPGKGSSIDTSYSIGYVTSPDDESVSWGYYDLVSTTLPSTSLPILQSDYYNYVTSNKTQGCPGGCSGLTGMDSDQMVQQTNYDSNWDFGTVWDIDNGVTYPCHQWWTASGHTCPPINTGCISQFSFGCYSGDVYWFDSCGYVETYIPVADDCGVDGCDAFGGYTCNDTMTRIRNQTCYFRGCNVSTDPDSCYDNPYTNYETITCGGGTSCIGGACVALTAEFSADKTSVATGEVITFTDLSTGDVSTYEWDFDNDGSVDSNEANPLHSYFTPGTYDVSLTVYGPAGSDSETKTVYITVTGITMPTDCGTVTDADGNVYGTLLIGSQCWMASNLKVGTQIPLLSDQTDNSIIEKYCQSDDTPTCDKYGGYYIWDEVMNYSAVEGSKGICPDGWHVPKDDDYKILEGNVDSFFGVGDPEWDSNGWRGSDAGSNLKIGGSSNLNLGTFGWYTGTGQEFNAFNDDGYFWTSTIHGGDSFIRRIENGDVRIERADFEQEDGCSVRCIQDTGNSAQIFAAGEDSAGHGVIYALDEDGLMVWELATSASGFSPVAVDADGYVYVGMNNGNIMKLDPDGNPEWTNSDHSAGIGGLAVDADGYVYSASSDGTARKISPSGTSVGIYSGHSGTVSFIDVDKFGNTFTSSYDDTVRKIIFGGGEDWIFTGFSNDVRQVAVDADGYVYAGGSDTELKKITPGGTEVWSNGDHTSYIYGIDVDDDGYVYSCSRDYTLRKFDSSNGNPEWVYTDSYTLHDVAVDDSGNSYVGGEGTVGLTKVDSDGNFAWKFNGNFEAVFGVAVKPSCMPNCIGKLCGDDGCGGSCGSCSGCQNCFTGVCQDDENLCGTDGCSLGIYYDYSCNSGSCSSITPNQDSASSYCCYTWTGNGGESNCCGDDTDEGQPYEAAESTCDDGNDNDCDGDVDCADSDCSGSPSCATFPNCGTVDYGGKTYNTIVIGSQCWLRENLDIGTRRDGSTSMSDDLSIEKYCYNDQTSYCDNYGGLYNWNEAMDYTSIEGIQGICPDGWHIASHDEWTTLEREVCTSGTCATDFPYDESVHYWTGTDEGTKLKEGGSSGFDAKLGGDRSITGSFEYLGSRGHFWTSTESSTIGNQWRRRFDNTQTSINRHDNLGASLGFSIRCVQGSYCGTNSQYNRGLCVCDAGYNDCDGDGSGNDTNGCETFGGCVLTGILFSGNDGGEAHKINPSTMTYVDSCTGYSGRIFAMAYGSDDYLYSGGDDDQVHKIDPSTMTEVDTYYGHSDNVYALAFGTDGYLYSSSYDLDVHKIDPSTMSKVGSYNGHTNVILALAFGTDGYLYSGASDNEVHKIDPLTMTQVDVYTGHSNNIFALAFGTDGYLYSGDRDDEVHKIDPLTMTQVDIYTGHGGYVYALAFGTDGYLYSGSGDDEVHKIDPLTMTQVDAYTGSSSIRSLVYGTDNYLYSGDYNGRVHKIDPLTMTEVDTYWEAYPIYGLAWNKNIADMISEVGCTHECTSDFCLGDSIYSCAECDADSCLDNCGEIQDCNDYDGYSCYTGNWVISVDYYCSGGSCSYSNGPLIEDCDDQDGYYCYSGDVRRYRDYSCSSGSCTYTTGTATDCDSSDGCYSDIYRNYYCSSGSCTYTTPDQDSSSTYCCYTWAGNGGSLNCCGDDANEGQPYEATETTCNDGRDNDCDGDIDGDDSDCPATFCEDISDANTYTDILGDRVYCDNQLQLWTATLNTDITGLSARDSCISLNYGGRTNWQLPTVEQLREDFGNSACAGWSGSGGSQPTCTLSWDPLSVGEYYWWTNAWVYGAPMVYQYFARTPSQSSGSIMYDTQVTLLRPYRCIAKDQDVSSGVCEYTWTGNGGQNNCCGDDQIEGNYEFYGIPYESPETTCSDYFDNDCDGLVDSADPDCAVVYLTCGGSTHTEAECLAQGGTVEDAGGCTVCKMAISCDTGWNQYLDWGDYSSNSCGTSSETWTGSCGSVTRATSPCTTGYGWQDGRPTCYYSSIKKDYDYPVCTVEGSCAHCPAVSQGLCSPLISAGYCDADDVTWGNTMGCGYVCDGYSFYPCYADTDALGCI